MTTVRRLLLELGVTGDVITKEKLKEVEDAANSVKRALEAVEKQMGILGQGMTGFPSINMGFSGSGIQTPTERADDTRRSALLSAEAAASKARLQEQIDLLRQMAADAKADRQMTINVIENLSGLISRGQEYVDKAKRPLGVVGRPPNQYEYSGRKGGGRIVTETQKYKDYIANKRQLSAEMSAGIEESIDTVREAKINKLDSETAQFEDIIKRFKKASHDSYEFMADVVRKGRPSGSDKAAEMRDEANAAVESGQAGGTFTNPYLDQEKLKEAKYVGKRLGKDGPATQEEVAAWLAKKAAKKAAKEGKTAASDIKTKVMDDNGLDIFGAKLKADEWAKKNPVIGEMSQEQLEAHLLGLKEGRTNATSSKTAIIRPYIPLAKKLGLSQGAGPKTKALFDFKDKDMNEHIADFIDQILNRAGLEDEEVGQYPQLKRRNIGSNLHKMFERRRIQKKIGEIQEEMLPEYIRQEEIRERGYAVNPIERMWGISRNVQSGVSTFGKELKKKAIALVSKTGLISPAEEYLADRNLVAHKNAAGLARSTGVNQTITYQIAFNNPKIDSKQRQIQLVRELEQALRGITQ